MWEGFFLNVGRTCSGPIALSSFQGALRIAGQVICVCDKLSLKSPHCISSPSTSLFVTRKLLLMSPLSLPSLCQSTHVTSVKLRGVWLHCHCKCSSRGCGLHFDPPASPLGVFSSGLNGV